MTNEKKLRELEEELQALYQANAALSQENGELQDATDGLEGENGDLKAALWAVAQQLRNVAEGIDEALERLESPGFN